MVLRKYMIIERQFSFPNFHFQSKARLVFLKLSFALQQYCKNIMQKSKQVSKRNHQSINMFEYYTKELFPSLFKDLNQYNKIEKKMQANYRNINYHYLSDSQPGFQNIQPEVIKAVSQIVYLKNYEKKQQANGFKETRIKLNYLPLSQTVRDHIQIIVSHTRITHSDHKIRSSTSLQTVNKTNSYSTSQKCIKSQPNIQNEIYLYIIHTNRIDLTHKIKWLNFIEKYTFYSQQYNLQTDLRITHQVVFSYSVEDNSLLNFAPKFLQSYLEQCCPFVQGKSVLLNSIVTETKKILKSSVKRAELVIKNASFDPVHRRQLRLKEQHKRVFTELKPKIYSYFETINPTRKPNPYFLENTLCRLMENNSYKLQDSWSAVKHYLDFEKRIRQKYVWEDFEQYHKMSIFIYLGKTYLGRPLMLGRARNCLMSKISDLQLFFDYFFFFFEIYSQDQMEGWVDQMDILIDGLDMVRDNVDFGFATKLVFSFLKTTLGRGHHHIGFNISFLAKILEKFFTPLVPERLMKSVQLFEAQQEPQLRQRLRQIIPEEVIPDFLGGLNTNTTYEFKKLNKIQNKRKQRTESTSFSHR